ncbi:hypothetical protein CTZ27_36245 [Streptomyces griseocarneus]|nr:hypothetical protein CTZ27_36245 [Streptomyces griseocarneus]
MIAEAVSASRRQANCTEGPIWDRLPTVAMMNSPVKPALMCSASMAGPSAEVSQSASKARSSPDKASSPVATPSGHRSEASPVTACRGEPSPSSASPLIREGKETTKTHSSTAAQT